MDRSDTTGIQSGQKVQGCSMGFLNHQKWPGVMTPTLITTKEHTLTQILILVAICTNSLTLILTPQAIYTDSLTLILTPGAIYSDALTLTLTPVAIHNGLLTLMILMGIHDG